jgi:hypothetical protein
LSTERLADRSTALAAMISTKHGQRPSASSANEERNAEGRR